MVVTVHRESFKQTDWIAVGTVANTVQISSISGNTFNLSKSINWTNGDPVWLYKKTLSLDVQVFKYTNFSSGLMDTLHFPVYSSNVLLPLINASKYLKCFGGGTFSSSLSFISDNQYDEL